jgi:PTS system mannose-specific IID component
MSNKLTEADVKRAMLRSWGYQWLSFNYETMQSPGFTWFITPALQKIYGDDKVVSKKANQYLTAFYNTENTMGQIIHGAILGLEESGVDGVTDTAVALRTGLMGPFAGLGDSIFKVSSKVIFGSLAGYMALDGSIVGLLLCVALCIFCNGFCRYWFFMGGYHQGVEFITKKQDMIQGLTAAVTVMGLTVIGAMIPSTVKVTVPLVYTFGEATQSIQDILDTICPYLLPALITFLIYKGLGNKKMTTVRMVWLIILVCIILTWIGIL